MVRGVILTDSDTYFDDEDNKKVTLKEKIITEYSLLIASERDKPHPNYNGVQNKIARKFRTTASYVSRCLADLRNVTESNPTVQMIKYADQLKDTATQLELQLEFINECDDRIRRHQELGDKVEEYLTETKRVLEELELKIDAFDPSDLATGDDNIPIIRRLLSSKRSPLNMLSAIDMLKNLLAEERKETLAKNTIIQTINSASKLVLAINNMYYGGDPTTWDAKTMERVSKYWLENVCVNCNGYPYMGDTAIDVEGEELDDDEELDDIP